MLIQGWVRKGIAKIARLDTGSHALVTVHAKDAWAHEGNGYILTQRKALNAFDIASPMTFYIVTPAATVGCYHMTASGCANTAAYIEIFEDDGTATHFAITGGSAYVPLNRDRSSANTSGLTTCKTGVTIGYATADCLISTGVMGRNGGTEEFALILKPSTEYLVRATSYDENNEGSLQVNLFRHDDLDASHGMG